MATLYGEGDEQAVACADMLGRALGAEGDVGGATEACRASLRYKEELYGTDSVEVADAHNELSVLLQQTGDVEKAEVEAIIRRAMFFWQRTMQLYRRPRPEGMMVMTKPGALYNTFTLYPIKYITLTKHNL